MRACTLPCGACAQLSQARATSEKEAGNRAFAGKQFKQAVEHFTNCIELDPECVTACL